MIETKRTLAAVMLAVILLTGCNRGSVASPSPVQPAAQQFATATTIAGGSNGLLVTGNTGSSYIAVFVNGLGYETIAPGNETERSLAAGFYRVTFEPSAEFIETASGETIADCIYPRLQIIAGKTTSAYCAE